MSKRNVVHVEIPAADPNSTAEFYRELFGWKIVPVPEMNYVMWEAADGSGGGFPPISEENPAGRVTVYIDSDDIDADLEKVNMLGGRVLHEKAEIPGMGWFGIFQDPDGNVLALYQSMKR
jgi:predicted enzyme related to lactoylglutathione lyase